MRRKLTPKQKAFAQEYIKSGNATQSAIKAGYSFKTAGVIGSENLEKPDIKAYIEKKLAEIESKKIATAKEVMEYYTRVLRGEEKEEVTMATATEIKTVEQAPSIKERTAAAKELMKRYPMGGANPMIEQQLRKMKADADYAEIKASIAKQQVQDEDDEAENVDDLAHAIGNGMRGLFNDDDEVET